MNLDPTAHPHRRYSALTDEWILVSPHRTRRPWQGQQESVTEERPPHDPTCYLCPGNTRAGEQRNPDYQSTHVFTNDFAALLPDVPSATQEPDGGFFRFEPTRGTCRVVCYSPRHDLTLAEMKPSDVRRVIDVWAEQTAELGETYSWVQVFENKGTTMGCSNSHPHGQIWACDHLPTEPAKEDRAQRVYLHTHGSRLLLDYAAAEHKQKERIVVETGEWLAVVPYWAIWPFETLLLPRKPVARIHELEDASRDDLASILKRLLVKYDNLFQVSFSYSMGWHGAPCHGDNEAGWQLHAHFYPPLLRSATVRKFMVGFEMLAEAQRDLTAEEAAARLRELPEAHYRECKTSSPA